MQHSQMNMMSAHLWSALPAGLGFLYGHCLVPSGGTQVSPPAMKAVVPIEYAYCAQSLSVSPEKRSLGISIC